MKLILIYSKIIMILLFATGCNVMETGLSDVAGGTGGAALGYAFSSGKRLPTLIGAAGGVGASKLMQKQVNEKIKESYDQGYNEAMSQNVKQQYWIIQNRQKENKMQACIKEDLVPVMIPEQIIDGVLQEERLEYIRVER